MEQKKKNPFLSQMKGLADLKRQSEAYEQKRSEQSDSRLKTIPLTQIITKAQPRTTFENLDELAASLKEIGQQTPIVVYREDDKYVIEQGERRYRAAKLAGLESLECLVSEQNEKHRVIRQLAENIQREAMTLADLSTAVKELNENGFPIREIAKLLGKKESYVSLLKRVAVLPEALERVKQNAFIQDPIALSNLSALYDKFPKDVERQIKKWEKGLQETKEKQEKPFMISRGMVTEFVAKTTKKYANKTDKADVSETDDQETVEKELPEGCSPLGERELDVLVLYKGKPAKLVLDVVAPEGKLCIDVDGRLQVVKVGEVRLQSVSTAE